MTDTRLAGQVVEVVVVEATSNVRTAAQVVEALIVQGLSSVSISGQVVEVLVREYDTSTTRPTIRTAGSNRPVQMKWSDNQWRNVQILE